MVVIVMVKGVCINHPITFLLLSSCQILIEVFIIMHDRLNKNKYNEPSYIYSSIKQPVGGRVWNGTSVTQIQENKQRTKNQNPYPKTTRLQP